MEQFYQGSLDVFLTKVRADFDTVEDQAEKAISALEVNGLLKSENMPNALFTEVSNIDSDGDRAVWRNISVTGIKQLGTRKAGGNFPEATFIRGYETAVYDPDTQDASEIVVPEERQDKEGKMYKSVLNRATKLIIEGRRKNIGDPFDVFNHAFTAPTSYPVHFNAKGNLGLDGNLTALGERLISIAHARADGGTTISNAVQNSGNAAPFNVTYYEAALEQGQTFKDDVGKPMPMFGGSITVVVPPANGLVATAKEIVDSEWAPGTANNEINAFKGTFNNIISSPYLSASYNTSSITDTRKWFLVDTSTQDPEVGTGLVRVCFVPTNSRVGRDQRTQAVMFQYKQSYNYVWTDFRNVLGSKGDNASYTG